MRKIFFILFLMTVSLNSYAKETITFIPQWYPQAQFAGYYVAYEKGFYKKYGLNVKILTGGYDTPSTEYLTNKKADIATMWLSTAIKLKSQGVNLVNIAQILKRSSLVIVAWNSKIKTLKNLNGKKIGVWSNAFIAPLEAFVKKYDIHAKIIPQMGSINLFLKGGVDAATAMWYNEYDIIINSGIEENELTTFMLYKYGLNFPEDGIYVLKETLDKYPNLCKSFVKASIEGWLYAFKHKKEAIRIVMKYMFNAHVPTNVAHQKWMLDSIEKAFFYNSKNKIGLLDKSDYYNVTKILKEEGFIKRIPKFEDFFKDCYVKK